MSPSEKMVESARTYGPAGYGLLRGVTVEYGLKPAGEFAQRLGHLIQERIETARHHQHVQPPLPSNVVQLELPPAIENLPKAA